MLIRYKKGLDGLDAVARVYSKEENKIDISLVDKDAISVINKLNDYGYESYLVGGAVRDLILGRKPKDFDVATAASPRQVHRIFTNSRVIGRRFKIVHIIFGRKIIEVSTFRSTKDHDYSNDNRYGTIEEDCRRRDFTINSLYYDPIKEVLIDFNNALSDFEHRRLISLLPLNKTFDEDPVRMIRAIKYSVTTGFKIPLKLALAIKKYSSNIATVSTSRMTDEVQKILCCGNSSEIFKKLNNYKLLVYILPAISVYASFPQMFESLAKLDKLVNEKKNKSSEHEIGKATMYLALIKPFLNIDKNLQTTVEIFNDLVRQTKVLLSPITPPNYDLEKAVSIYLKEQGINVPKSLVKHKKPSILKYRRKRREMYQNDIEDNEVVFEVKKKKKRKRKRKKPNAVLQNQTKVEHAK